MALGRLAATSCALLFLAPLAASARDDAAVEGIERMVSATVTVTANGVTVSEPRGFERRGDGAERPLALGSSGEGAFGCQGTGDAYHLGDVRLPAGGAGGLFSLYSLPGQRGGEDTTQVLVCLTGGARPGQDERLLQAGVGAAYEGDETRRLGMRWLTGPTPPRGEDGWLFAGSRTAGAEGFIEQAPADHLKGSFIGPFESDFDDHFRNAVAGWWEADCVDDRDGCGTRAGSEDFQGSLAGALWEFPASEESHRFRVAVFWATSGRG